MKKIMTAMLAALMLASFCACEGNSGKKENESTTPEETGCVTEEKKHEPISADASVTVSDKKINTVGKLIFGDNTSYSGEGYGLWDAETGAPEPKLLEMLKNCGITHLRYPGGVEGDYYHWNEIIGEDRVGQIDPFSHEFPTYTEAVGVPYDVKMGITEFVDLCAQAGIQPVLQINAGTGTAEEAVGLIKYCLDNGIACPFFAVGNEGYSGNNPVAGYNIRKTPAEYVKFYNEIYKEAEKLGADIKLGAIGIPASNPLCSDREWNKIVIRALAGRMDFYDVHIGYAPLVSVNSQKTALDCYLGGAKWVRKQLDDVEYDLKTYGGKDADNIGIYMTEWGTLGGGVYDNSLAGATYVASVLNIMLNDPKVEASNHLPLLNHPSACNIIGYENRNGEKRYWKNVSSYVFSWYSDMIGRDVLDLITETPVFDTVKGTAQPAQTDVPAVEAIAFRDAAEKKLTVIVINRDKKDKLSVSFELPYGDLSVTSVNEIWHSDPLAFNSYEDGDLITEKNVSPARVKANGKQLVYETKPVSLTRIDIEYN